jgi:hypothetical protein
MKQLKLLILFSIIILNYCDSISKQDFIEPVNLDLTNLKVDLELTNTLFTFDEKNFQEKTNKKVAKLLKLANETLIDNKNATNVIYNLKIENGNVFIENISLVNTTTKKVIKQQKYNSKMLPDFDVLFNGAKCPSGYSQLASFKNTGETQECVGVALAKYLSENLSSVGDCTNVNVSVGLFSTRVFGQTC